MTAIASGAIATGNSMAQVGNAVRALVAQPSPALRRAEPVRPALVPLAVSEGGELNGNPAGTASAARPAEPDRATIARMRGYQGDSCGECGELHAGAERDVFEVRHVREYDGVFVVIGELSWFCVRKRILRLKPRRSASGTALRATFALPALSSLMPRNAAA